MQYKLLALDMDDTLLSEDLSISKKNVEAIRLIESMGVKIILCSGRPYVSMAKYLDVLDIHSEDDFIVSFNGAFINKISGEEIYSNIIEGDVLHELIDIGRERNISVHLYDETFVIEKYTDRSQIYEGLTGMKAKIIDDLKVMRQSIKVLFNHSAGPDLEDLRLELVEKYGDKFNIFYSKPYYIEVLNNKSSKGLAVEYVAKRMGIDREAVMTVGDGFNDVSMLQYAGLGIAVANAPDGVKAHANYITKSTHNEDAIWEVFETFFE